jgi:hypothetical protein
MDGERVDYDNAFRAMRGVKRITVKEWSNLLLRLKMVEQELERIKNGAIHDHHADGGPS